MKSLIVSLALTSLLATTAFAGPIHDAAGAGRKKAVEQHIANGADVNAKDGDGLTPLHEAASGGHKEIVELLIASGADVNAKDEDGDTPLDQTYKTHSLLRKHCGKTDAELKAEGK